MYSIIRISESIKAFQDYPIKEEKSSATVQKYAHNVWCLAGQLWKCILDKAAVVDYKLQLCEKYAPAM